jgi:diguanylate cyclase (GGDEF)-like protein
MTTTIGLTRARVQRHGPPALVAVLLVVAALLDVPLLLSSDGPILEPGLPIWLLAVCWLLLEVVDLHFRYGKDLDNSQRISLTEFALALGLLYATPRDLLLVGVGTLVVLNLLRRRQSPLKQAFNAATLAVGVGLAITLYRFLGTSEPLSARGWVTLAVSTTVSGALAAVLVALVLALATGRAPSPTVVRLHVGTLPLFLVCASGAFVAALALKAGAVAVVPLVLTLAAVLLLVRTVSVLTDRHLDLATLQGLGQRLSAATDDETIVAWALEAAADLLVAREAEAYVCLPGIRVQYVRLRRPGVERLELDPDEVPRGRGVTPGRTAVVAAAPLTQGGEVVIAVRGRASGVRPFNRENARLLGLVAHQTAANLRTAHLIAVLSYDALHDQLTDLPNRRLLLDTVHDRMSRQQPVTMVWLALRGLQTVNAALGHALGDELLVQVGTRLRATAGEHGVVARVGGNEFVVLLPDTDEVTRTDTVTMLLAEIGRPFLLSNAPVLVRASAGVAFEPPGSGATAQELLRHADIAMRHAHRTGRAVEHYAPPLETSTPALLTLATELHSAIRNDELTLFAQPQIRLKDGVTTGVEMLVRWQHPRLGLLQPASFIELAEQTGLDRAMTGWVLDAAMAAAARWHRQGLDLTVSVNVSPGELADRKLLELTEENLARHELPRDRLVIEVIESSLITSTTMAADVLAGLSALGVRVSIDDFGTGFSSLSHLRRLPVDEIKIDKAFVQTMLSDEDDGAIVRSVVRMGRSLGLAVVAEGVEEAAVYHALRELGCDTAQGYYMARPMRIEEVPGWVRRSNLAAPYSR